MATANQIIKYSLLGIIAAIVCVIPFEVKANDNATQTTFYFAADLHKKKKWPGWHTSLLVLRNTKKLRPLYVTGVTTEGKLVISFGSQSSELEDLVDGGDEVAELLDYGNTKGHFVARMARYSVNQAQADQFAGTKLVQTVPNSKGEYGEPIDFKITRITSWQPRKSKKGKKIKTSDNKSSAFGTYKAKAHVTVTTLGKSAKIIFPVDITMINAKRTEKASHPAQFVLSGRFKLKGSDIGLTGDDAGELSGYFNTRGFTDFKEDAKKILEKKLDVGDPDGFPGLD